MKRRAPNSALGNSPHVARSAECEVSFGVPRLRGGARGKGMLVEPPEGGTPNGDSELRVKATFPLPSRRPVSLLRADGPASFSAVGGCA